MNRCVELPFCTPVFASMPAHASAGLAISSHPTAYNGMLNVCTNISCKRDFIGGYTSPCVDIPRLNIYSLYFIERNIVSLRYVSKFVDTIIKQMLDDGYYVHYYGVDDFYLPGKSWYGTRHMHHSGTICGYDDDDETYSIAAYDIDWVYRLIRIPRESFSVGLASSLKDGYYGYLVSCRAVKEDVPLSEKSILRGMREYINSNFEKYPSDKDGEVSGIVVHDYLAMYIDKLKDGSIPYEKMDWRALRPVWEHKKCMLDRIKAVENKNGWSNELSERYAPVVEKANCIRMMYAMYHKNHNDKLLDKIRDGLLELADSDREIVGEFISRLEELVK